ncbi:MAG TPA: acyl-CoA dehydrogenase [Streptomyces sp.]|nr:acyl-CoA dehydrogenase [Streptomyces sp.]
MTAAAPAVAHWPRGLPDALEAAMNAAARGERPGPFSPQEVARLDAREEFPAEACAVLDACGLARAYVPAPLGGAGGGLPELLASLRAVARRDVTVAVAHGKTYLGSVPTWVAGDDRQRRALARRVLDEHAVVSWGLTEPGRGSDLLAGRLTATPDGPGGGHRLDGTKWPVNNATRGDLVSVLARTSPDGGPRGFSIFLVDKSRLPPGSWSALPKEPTHGIRGADISGIRFTGAGTPADAATGAPGQGLEIVLRSLQLTRTVCTALSLGAGEHALRLAHAFAAGRELYGTTLLRLPLARRVLGRAAASLELADAAALLAARSAHCLTGEMSVVSAVAKAGVPDIVQQTIDELAELLGARGYLTGLHAHGMFQKLERDHRIVGVFDGTTAVNRSALISQFPVLARLAREGRHDGPGLAAALGTGLPPLDHAALRLTSRTGCSVVQALPTAVERLLGHPRAHAAATALAEETARLAGAMAALRPAAARDTPAEAFALARRYELCFAGAAAVHLLAAAPGDPVRAPRLTAAAERALELLVPGRQAPDDAYEPLLAALPSPAEDPRHAHPVKEPLA